jgi:hypothetical protein
VLGSLSVNPTGAAEAVARSLRARGLREVPQTEDSDGDGGAEGGENLSNRSCSAPCEGGGGLSNSRGSASARCTLDLSDSDGADIDSDDDVIASGEPMDGVPRSVGTGSEDESKEDEGTGASFRRSTRIRRPNVRLREYMLDIPASLVIQSVNELLEPTSVEEALAAPDVKEWIKALDTEYQELMRNHVWELVERPKGVKVLKNKWVFVRKRNAKGEVCRYRTRITIKGCQQQFGVNFWETDAPVAKAESVRFILLLALNLGLLCHQVDFVTAFLNGPIGEAELYMEQPDYFDDDTVRVCKLQQSLYGLRASGTGCLISICGSVASNVPRWTQVCT